MSKLRRLWEGLEDEVTPKHQYLSRREFMKAAAATFVGVAAAPLLGSHALAQGAVDRLMGLEVTDETPTSFRDVTTYNNFYEFGFEKDDPARLSRDFVTRPWSVTVDGLVEHPGVYDLDELLPRFEVEERIYRMRCVEAWSMVIPWRGFMLRDLIDAMEPQAEARYVAFETLYDPDQMPGQRRPILPWPYVEGLRMDEAMHPLTLIATGLYGQDLPNQNGAPLRLVVPWKYGFKSIKSIVRISFTADQPPNTWNLAAPHEYGFYANVNPEVNHPRWSQATERRIGEFRRRPTLPFNGYGEVVADLYEGMDLRVHY